MPLNLKEFGNSKSYSDNHVTQYYVHCGNCLLRGKLIFVGGK